MHDPKLLVYLEGSEVQLLKDYIFITKKNTNFKLGPEVFHNISIHYTFLSHLIIEF